MKLNIVASNNTGRVLPLSWTREMYRLPAGQTSVFAAEDTKLFEGGSAMDEARTCLDDMISKQLVSVSVETDFPIRQSKPENISAETVVAPQPRTTAKVRPDLQASIEAAQRLAQTQSVLGNVIKTLPGEEAGVGRLSPAPGTGLDDEGQRVIDLTGGKDIAQAYEEVQTRQAEHERVQQLAAERSEKAKTTPTYRSREVVAAGADE